MTRKRCPIKFLVGEVRQIRDMLRPYVKRTNLAPNGSTNEVRDSKLSIRSPVDVWSLMLVVAVVQNGLLCVASHFRRKMTVIWPVTISVLFKATRKVLNSSRQRRLRIITLGGASLITTLNHLFESSCKAHSRRTIFTYSWQRSAKLVISFLSRLKKTKEEIFQGVQTMTTKAWKLLISFLGYCQLPAYSGLNSYK